MSLWIVNIHGDIEGDYEIIEEYKEPEKARWIHTDECDEEWPYRCSKCNLPSRSNAHRYCPNCGRMMYDMVYIHEHIREGDPE